MIAELMKRYVGVACHWCREPISLSAKVANLLEKIADSEANSPRAFVARCKFCEYESVYTVSDVQSSSESLGYDCRGHERRGG